MADLNKLLEARQRLMDALGNPAMSVTVAGQRYDFREMAEIEQALANVDRQIKAAQGHAPLRKLFVRTSKGT